MEIIAELEGTGRGPYTGSMGYIDTRGRACFNVLIRSLLWRPRPELGEDAGEVSFRVGGGITWASDPEQELRELEAKGRAIFSALHGT